ncbi:UDP-N-acetylmuramoylalanyl-D-glutamyl-2,6-diaminopimelate--D-alanyl-D-alanine ligase [Pelagibius litoralis]|uniref:UDP-N-acetylmuramoyl-tripeptide--D-alanyl-D-alanine ligase n=1 Tax=Pelagibius litoralis TaxID=374515 RepID=A0A967C6T8_9PROT|nr:UDP-N-acetylmuramoylalanyl-D-glutamyl-2,6-diaminopimelate--D-alanyl-D-alanine ligase [Pelagibius litoralis]NIA68621.1 UDP-N-acetylmuramoylalanyl-D-glutamyl-2,6-diaminopimelate--D-alanyl-D-alanine ligase [Pelagibius litoralis]
MTAASLWTAEEVAQATGGRITGDWQASGVSIDSRSLEAGDLFVALKGPSFDGHDYAGKAIKAGAAAALVHRRADGIDESDPLIIVDDSFAALWRLGTAARERSQARLIAVTGSVGKTGTKEALRLCLEPQGITAASVGSFNNHWGVPLSLARMQRDAAYGIFELGMNHAGEISELTALVRPHVAIITNIEPAHLGNFDSIAGIADAKAEIFEGMDANGCAILNRDNAFFHHLRDKAETAGIGRILSFGRHKDADARLVEESLHATCSSVKAIIRGSELDYCIALPGSHWVMNSLAVLAAVGAAGADPVKAAAQLAGLNALKGRGERHTVETPGGSFKLIDDSYNANPTSMRAAVDVLGRSTLGAGGRRIAVLGDMLELGAQSTEMHAKLAEPLREAGVDLVFTCGSEMAALHEALPQNLRGAHGASSQDLAAQLAEAVKPGDSILVKGSLGSRMALVVEALLALDQSLPRAANGQ